MPVYSVLRGRQDSDGNIEYVDVDAEGQLFVTDAALELIIKKQAESFDLMIELLERLNHQMSLITGVQLEHGDKL